MTNEIVIEQTEEFGLESITAADCSVLAEKIDDDIWCVTIEKGEEYVVLWLQRNDKGITAAIAENPELERY